MVENTIRIGGAVTFWTIGERTLRSALVDGFKAAGFEKFCPEPRPPAGALRDALEHVLGGPKTLIRPLEDRDGFTVVDEDRGKNGNVYRNSLVARIDADTLQITFVPFDDRATAITESFNENLGLLKPAQVSHALVAILDSMFGTRLRPSGAVYWLPADRLDDWQRVGHAVEAASAGRPHAVYILRNQMDADAVRAVQDAVVTQIAAEAASIEAEVNGGELGVRALENRQQLAELLRKKIGEYEAILGRGLDSLREAVEKAEQAACNAAILAAANPQEASCA